MLLEPTSHCHAVQVPAPPLRMANHCDTDIKYRFPHSHCVHGGAPCMQVRNQNSMSWNKGKQNSTLWNKDIAREKERMTYDIHPKPEIPPGLSHSPSIKLCRLVISVKPGMLTFAYKLARTHNKTHSQKHTSSSRHPALPVGHSAAPVAKLYALVVPVRPEISTLRA